MGLLEFLVGHQTGAIQLLFKDGFSLLQLYLQFVVLQFDAAQFDGQIVHLLRLLLHLGLRLRECSLTGLVLALTLGFADQLSYFQLFLLQVGLELAKSLTCLPNF